MAAEVTTIQLDDGTIVGPANPMPMNGANVFNTDVTVHDGVTVGNKLAIDAHGKVTVAQARSMATGQAATGTNGAAVQVVAADSARSFVKITNISAHTIFLGTSNAVTTGTGQAIPAGQTQDFPTLGAIWAVSAATGDTVTFAAFTA